MKYATAICIAALVVAGCNKKEPAAEQATATPPVAAPEPAPSSVSATAQLAATKGHTASGMLTLTAEGEGVHLTGTLQGLPPNAELGFHIHEKGDCSADDASSAGAHFNPSGAEHGSPLEAPHHAGDMLNAKSDAQGNATVDVQATAVTLGDGGASDVVGKAVVVHEKADDYKSQPAGNSGARIACGVITASPPTSVGG